MLLTIQDLIYLLRDSINIQTKDTEVIDPLYLAMSDDDLLLYLKLAVSHAYPDVSDISELEEGCEYPLVLLAKIDLYMKLAVLRSEKVDLGADNNNYIKNSQRFDHYMKLAEEAKQEYQDYLDDIESGGLGSDGVTAYNLLLSKRHYSNRNYTYQKTPKVHIKIDEVTSNSVAFQWSIKNSSFFGRAKVYISTSPIFDIHKDGAMYKDKINEDAKLIKSTSNIRDNAHRIEDLTPSTTYYLAVFSIERNQVFGCQEITFDTLEEYKAEDEEDIDVGNLNE